MTLKRKVAVIAVVGVLLLGFGAVRFALAVDNDMKQTMYEIQLAQGALQKASSDYKSMVDQSKNMMQLRAKGDTTDQVMGQYMESQAALVADLMQADQHTLNAVQTIAKHLNK